MILRSLRCLRSGRNRTRIAQNIRFVIVTVCARDSDTILGTYCHYVNGMVTLSQYNSPVQSLHNKMKYRFHLHRSILYEYLSKFYVSVFLPSRKPKSRCLEFLLFFVHPIGVWVIQYINIVIGNGNASCSQFGIRIITFRIHTVWA